MKVDTLLAQPNSNEDNFDSLPGTGVPSNDEHRSNKNRNETELSQRVSSLKKDVEKKTELDKRFKAEVLENKIKADIKMDGVEFQISEMTNNLSSLRIQLSANEQLRETMKERVDRFENAIEDISKRGEEESSLVGILSQQAARDRTDLDLLRDKMDSLEQQLQLNNQRIEDIKRQCGEVCQLVAINLVPLEELREGLSQNVIETNMNKSWLVELDKDVTELQCSVSDAVVTPVGFTAYFNEPIRLLTSDTILTGFTDVRVNIQDCFNPITCCFMAPVDGLYAASVTLCQMSTGYVEAFLHHRERGSPDSTWVARVIGHREINGNSDTCVAVVSMKQRDELFIKIKDLGQLNYPWLTEGTSFSCFLINKL